MSRGTPVVSFRLLPSLKAEIMETIKRRNYYTMEAPWTFSDFLEQAIREKLAKMERSRDSKSRAKKIRLPKVDG